MISLKVQWNWAWIYMKCHVVLWLRQLWRLGWKPRFSLYLIDWHGFAYVQACCVSPSLYVTVILCNSSVSIYVYVCVCVCDMRLWGAMVLKCSSVHTWGSLLLSLSLNTNWITYLDRTVDERQNAVGPLNETSDIIFPPVLPLWRFFQCLALSLWL